MHELYEYLHSTVMSPEWWINLGGLWMIVFIIFAETGLFVGFFLPGDSLLFVAGILVHDFANYLFGPGHTAEGFHYHYILIMILISLAGVLGNFVGYWFGRKSGPFLYSRKDTFFWKKKHLLTAQNYYEEKGNFTIVLARFVPIIRTFAPIVAGIVKMDFKKFVVYNILGSFVWVFSMMLGGRLLRQFVLNKFGFDLMDKIGYVALIIILITTLPVLFKFLKPSKKAA